MMAIEASGKLNVSDDFDDDDGPVIFKRSNPTPKKNQLLSEVKKSTSSLDGLSQRKTTDMPSSNGQNSGVQKSKIIPSVKTSPTKASVDISKASTSRVCSSNVKSPVPNPKASLSGDKSKSLSGSRVLNDVKEEKPCVKHLPKENSEDSEDDEDNKPLSARLKINSNHYSKATPIVKKPIEDSDDDDDLPLSARLSRNAGTSGTGYVHSDKRKPLLKVQKSLQGGSSTSIKQEKMVTASVKRPLDKTSSLNSSVKKPKLSDPASSMKIKQVSLKHESKVDDDDDDDIPISQRLSKSSASGNKSSSVKKIEKAVKVNKAGSASFKKPVKKPVKKLKKSGSNSEYSKSTKLLPSAGDGQKKWTTLVHNGVIFPPPYNPHGIKMLYKGKPVNLTPEQEEVATMFAVMRDTDYMQKEIFKRNFWSDWRKLLGKNHIIQNLEDCDFTPIYDWYQVEKEKKKQMSTEEKKALKEEKVKQEEKYMWAVVDGVKEKVGNFRVEPPGLFRGRGEHPKMGKLKRRIRPSDITINIGKDASIPECPIPGETWKEIRHDNTVTWLAFWNDPINPKLFKYVFLAASSSLKGQSDKEKYEKARMLKNYIGNIRAAYTKDFTIRDITRQQIAVATYLIDKLALRAGNEKDDDEADTVGCCTLKVENVTAEPPNKLQFNFLGKDSIKYENTVEVELPVYSAILKFQKDKRPGDDLFDKLDTSKLNAHLKELMPGLTAKVFRTFNASITLDDMLNKDTKDGDVLEKIGVYQVANKQVAIICNHQRSVSKSHSAQMSRLTEKIDELQGVLKELKTDLDRVKKGKPPLKRAERKRNLTPDALEKKIAQTNAKIEKMRRDMKTKEDLKTVALGTSKINYLDPRITVAWCKRHEVPIEKIFNKSLLAKFTWAMDVDPDFRF
ncbi:DNA topoisomerase 1 alpha-like isoform X2 [Prosopis cineraria]|uniref:DNA topoisomerase 1 alpha-like isoform X2 n=1 Tax=Prosopis cineraria TaxID=364024 RepID=UPI0024106BBD|nr:DNA topoisomerase 1 alpha-like isoform X2 [Prosopis cineraria]